MPHNDTQNAERNAAHAGRLARIAADMLASTRDRLDAVRRLERHDAARLELAEAYHEAALAVLAIEKAGEYDRAVYTAYHEARDAWHEAEAQRVAYMGARSAERPDNDA